ncbi:MAG: hypothetical protein WAO52_16195 [Prolixibacteraceae bacterium]
MRTFFIYLLGIIPFSLFAQNQPDNQNFCRQSKAESLIPIRPGIPGKQPFWNGKATMFKNAPSFKNDNTSWIISSPKTYRYSAFSFTDKRYYTFMAETPYEALTPIWDKLPNGEVYLKVESISADGLDFVLAGSRLFYKAAVFCPPYPEAKYSYQDAFRKGMQFMYNQGHIKNWYNAGKPDHSSHNLYCYSALEVGSVIDAMLMYNSLFPRNDTSLVIARSAADYLILNSEPAESSLAYFPQVYEGTNLAAGTFGKEIIITQPSKTGLTYLALYDKTKEKKYLNAAINIANTYIKNQLSSGTWYIRINRETGKPTSDVLCIPISIVNFLSELVNRYEQPQYQKAIDSSVQWIWENPMKTFDWTGQFEDVEAVEPYKNLTKYEASWFAQYLLNNEDKDTSFVRSAKELIAFCEDQFVVWETPEMYDNWKNSTKRWLAPSVLEQYLCYVPIDASVAQMIDTFDLAYEKTGDPMYRQKAIALTNSIVNSQKANGMIPTFWAPGFDEFWNNCMVSSLTVLRKMSTIK